MRSFEILLKNASECFEKRRHFLRFAAARNLKRRRMVLLFYGANFACTTPEAAPLVLLFEEAGRVESVCCP